MTVLSNRLIWLGTSMISLPRRQNTIVKLANKRTLKFDKLLNTNVCTATETSVDTYDVLSANEFYGPCKSKNTVYDFSAVNPVRNNIDAAFHQRD